MDINNFIEKHGETLKSGLMSEDCIGDFFDLILEMSASDKRSIISYLTRLYTHLLKYLYQPERQTRSWINSIRDSNRKLSDYEYSSKAIWNSITDDDITRSYNNARNYASRETNLPLNKFPKEPRTDFTIDNLINDEFIEKFLVDNAYSREARSVLYLD